MRKRNLFIFPLAIAMGAGAAYMASNWIAQSGTVVVAAIPLGYATALNRENVKELPWPAGQVPEGAYATKNELFKDGRRASTDAAERAGSRNQDYGTRLPGFAVGAPGRGEARGHGARR